MAFKEKAVEKKKEPVKIVSPEEKEEKIRIVTINEMIDLKLDRNFQMMDEMNKNLIALNENLIALNESVKAATEE